MNGFEKSYFGPYIFTLYILLLITVYVFGSDGSMLLITESVLTLLVTMMAISLPLYWSRKKRAEKEVSELMNSYGLLAGYIGVELANNIIAIQDIQKSNSITFEQLESESTKSEKEKMLIRVSIWEKAAEEMIYSLEDISHNSLIGSQAILTVSDNKVLLGAIKDAYTFMANLKSRLRRMKEFFNMIQFPPNGISHEVIDNILETRVPGSIRAVEKDIELLLDRAKKAINEINTTVEPYGEVVSIVDIE